MRNESSINFKLKNGDVVELTHMDLHSIARIYWERVYTNVAYNIVPERSDCPELYTDDDIEEVGYAVFDVLYDTETVYEEIENYLWTQFTYEKDEELKEAAA